MPTTSGGVSNPTFYYGGATRLRVGEDLSALGRPSIVVTTTKGGGGDADAIAAIHSINAKAYRYVQFYWVPDDADYEGINLYEHPEWAFCGDGREQGPRKEDNGGSRSWYFLDANEKSLRDHLRSLLDQYKAQGWDGVMFDRGEAATQYAKDIHGRPVWYKKSTCTSDPYKVGARFSDAYVNMLGLAHEAGLQAMMNNGKSPFDPIARMRPDPANASCQKARWSKCQFLSDIWSKLDLVLNESATRPKDIDWQRTFTANQRSEQSASYKSRTVALITTASLRGAQNQKRSTVFYAWSRVKLFDLATSVNTGDGGCGDAPQDAVCNRYGTYPELTNIDFGKVPGARADGQELCQAQQDPLPKKKKKKKKVWYKQSTCTSDPYKAGARFSDAYVNMLGLAHEAGLQTMMNNGKSPFDPVTRMRPDPSNVSCQKARWAKCHFLSDIWSKIDLVLNETATRPKDIRGNRRSRAINAVSGVRRTRAAPSRSSPRRACGAHRTRIARPSSTPGPRQAVRPRGLREHRRRGLRECVARRRVQPVRDLPQLTSIDFGKVQGTKPMAKSCAKRSKIHVSGCAATARA